MQSSRMQKGLSRTFFFFFFFANILLQVSDSICRSTIKQWKATIFQGYLAVSLKYFSHNLGSLIINITQIVYELLSIDIFLGHKSTYTLVQPVNSD